MASGRDERRQSDQGRRRLPRMGQIYGRRLRDIIPGEFEFRTLLIRPEKRDRQGLRLAQALTYLSWTSDGPVLTGSITLKRPAGDRPHSVPVKRGHLIRLLVRWHQQWYRLWDMRVNGEPDVDRTSGDINCELADDLDALKRNRRDWSFRKTKQRKKGWHPQEIAVNVCRREGVKMGRIAEVNSVWIDKLEQDNTSGLDIIKKAYKQASDETGKRYVMQFKRGRFEVIPLQRSKIAYIIKNMATGESTSGTPRHERPHTVIEGTAKVGDEKVTETLARPAIVRRFGRSVLEKDYGEIGSRDHLRELMERDLAAEIRVKLTATLTLPMIPFLERGSTVRWMTNEPGWFGPSENSRDRSWAFVRTASHSLDPSSQTTTVTLEQFDPYLADQRRRDKDARDKKRREREGRRGQ
jgi:hypothetical protein